MSEENLEIVRRGIEAWNARDVEAFVDLVGPDTEVVPVIAAPVHGLDAIRGWLRENFEMMDEFHADAGELRDLGDDVLVLGTVHARGQASGVEVDSPFGVVASFRAGRMARLEVFVDHGKALEAAG